MRMMVYDMENFLVSCVERYKQCTGSKEIKGAPLPYLPGEEPPSIFNTATKGGLNPDMRTLPPDYNEWLKANGLEPVEMDYTADDQWVYQQLASQGPVEPCSQTKGSKTIGKDGSDLSAVGELAPAAASVLMKIMYLARMQRFDLLRPVQWLAKFMTKWTRQQDLELHRLVCYMEATKSWKTIGWIGDDVKDISTVLYSDPDWAGSNDKFSTSGSFCCLKGTNSFFQGAKDNPPSHHLPPKLSWEQLRSAYRSKEYPSRYFGTP